MKKSIIYIVSFVLLFSCKEQDTVTPPALPKIEENELFVLESDYVKNMNIDSLKVIRNIFILNNSKKNVELKVEAEIPEEMVLKPPYSPVFESEPYPYDLFNKYFDIPYTSGNYLMGKPTYSTPNKYTWLTELKPSDAANISYSNYYGTKEKKFRKNYNTNNIFGLEIISKFNIEKNKTNPSYIDIRIEQTLTNKTKNTLITPFLVFFFPSNYTFSADYDIIFEMITYKGKYLAFDNVSIDGFGRRRYGKFYDFFKEKLLPNESIHFTIRETIKPLKNTLFLYPTNLLYFTSVEDEKIWNGNSIKANNQEYKGRKGYMKLCSRIVIPTYILFSINNGELKVIDHKEATPSYP